MSVSVWHDDILQWLLRFSGSVIGMLLGGFLLQQARLSFQTVFWLTGTVMLVVLTVPLIRFKEVKCVAHFSAADQIRDIWHYVQDPVYFRMIFFLLIMGSLPSSGDGFTNFLLGPLHFPHDIYAYITAVGIVVSGIAILVYKFFLRQAHLWLILSVATLSLAIMQLLQLVRQL